MMNKRFSFMFLLFFITLITVASVPAIAQKNVNSTLVNNSGIKSPSSLNVKKCPLPLISLSSTGLSKTKTSLCLDDCCLSCPIANNFYKENKIDIIFHVLIVLRVVSFICVLIIVISYIVLPNKREHPAITVLCFNISLLSFIGVTFFYAGDMRKIQCADQITQSTMRNNALCGVQGVILIFSTFLLVLWCFLLILHLHFQTVWKSNIIQRYHTVSQALIFCIAVTFTILPTAMGEITFEFGAICMVSSDYDNELFWYPLAVFAIPGVLIHFWTFIYIGKSQCMLSTDYYDESTLVSVTSKTLSGKEIVRAIKIQWRALMLALLLLIAYNVYWTYIIVEVEKLQDPDRSWLFRWLECIVQNGMNGTNAQDICSDYAVGHVPDVAYLTIAESIMALLGIGVFIVFGTSIDLWSEWQLYFIKKFDSVSEEQGGILV